MVIALPVVSWLASQIGPPFVQGHTRRPLWGLVCQAMGSCPPSDRVYSGNYTRQCTGSATDYGCMADLAER